MAAPWLVLGMALLLGTAGLKAGETGILVLAHGGAKNWDALVTELAARVNEQAPTEVAFGMADRSAMQEAVDRLAQRGVTDIVAVPLFISSHSSVFEALQYLLGARADAPPELEMFARMHHRPGADATTQHDGTHPVTAGIPIRMGGALDHDPTVTEILTARARAISSNPQSEVAIVVAHGPTSDEENLLWLQDMQIVAGGIQDNVPFARVEFLTVRDDAPAPIRDLAARHLREAVTRATSDGHRALIVPLVLAYGGIEDGIRKRLEGLEYQMATQALLPDERLVRWVMKAAAPQPEQTVR